MRKTSIIILTYNKLDVTKQCIESIREYTKKDDYEIIVVDNNSTDDTVNWLKDQDDITLILNDENKGFPAGCNQGLKIANQENDMLLLNNDVIVSHNWLDNLKIALYSEESVGIVGSVSNNISNFQQVKTDYTNLEGLHRFAKMVNISNPMKWERRLRLIGFCFLIKNETYKKVGLLDEIFTPGNFEDDDYSLRAQLAGYKLLLCKDSFIHHYDGVSFKEDSGKYSQLLKINEKKFEDKWGFKLLYSTHARLDLIEHIQKNPLDKFKLLEVGCGAGGTLNYLKAKYINAELQGLEISDGAAKLANTICKTAAGDIQDDEIINKIETDFDYILFGDVLEHLIDPWTVLQKLKSKLKPKGKIIISVPNIMHISVLSEITKGRFSYQEADIEAGIEAGILDKTHLRFFTLEEIVKMLITCGYSAERMTTTAVEITEEENRVKEKLLEITDPNIAYQYDVYQYILSAGLTDN